jgi:hypothetical protein
MEWTLDKMVAILCHFKMLYVHIGCCVDAGVEAAAKLATN